MITFILTVILFCILIIPHELGHFLMAKAAGIQVNEFAVGMGPTIYQKQKKETKYSLRAIPIGGYCAMEGENDKSDNPRAFNNKKWWQKILVLIAGAAMNVLVAVIAMMIALSITGITTTVLESVDTGGPAYEAGIKAGDEIVEIGGQEVEDWGTVITAIDQSEGESIDLTVLRDDMTFDTTVTPVLNDEERYVIGIVSKLNHSPLIGIKYSIPATWNMNKALLSGFKQMISGELSADDIAGPVGIINLVGDAREYGIRYFFSLVSLISLNIAIINLLPLPALDGGRIIFVIIRGITGDVISDELEGKIHAIGMILLLLFFVFITWNDISRLFS